MKKALLILSSLMLMSNTFASSEVSLSELISQCKSASRLELEEKMSTTQLKLNRQLQSSEFAAKYNEITEKLINLEDISSAYTSKIASTSIYSGAGVLGLVVASKVLATGSLVTSVALPVVFGTMSFLITRVLNSKVIGGAVQKSIANKSLNAYRASIEARSSAPLTKTFMAIKTNLKSANSFLSSYNKAHTQIRNDILSRASELNAKRAENIFGNYYKQIEVEIDVASALYEQDVLREITELSALRIENAQVCIDRTK